MSPSSSLEAYVDLPSGWRARQPEDTDVEALVRLTRDVQVALGHPATADPADVRSRAIGVGSWTRRQALVESPSGQVAAWSSVHDRAAGRTGIEVIVEPSLPDEEADDLGARLYRRAREVALDITRERHLSSTQLDATVYADDARSQRWLAAAGYAKVRTWLEMSRPVSAADAESEPTPLQPGVTLRRIQTHTDGTPKARDLQAVHRVLEESFEDHFNSYPEPLAEFVHRQIEHVGHSFDHWWLAVVEVDGVQLPGGAAISSALAPDANGVAGTYIDYLGVHRRARGRGVAKALLAAVVRDTAERERNRVELEVDADSPTHAEKLYTSLGWRTVVSTESWHQNVSA